MGVNKAEASKNNGSSKGGQAAKGGDVERIWVRCEPLSTRCPVEGLV